MWVLFMSPPPPLHPVKKHSRNIQSDRYPKDQRHEAHIHTQSRPLRSIMNSFCSNLQFFLNHQMVFFLNSQVSVWLLGVMCHIYSCFVCTDNTHLSWITNAEGTVTKNNLTTLDCTCVFSKKKKTRGYLTLRSGDWTSNKNKAELRSKNPQLGLFMGSTYMSQ